MQSARLEVVRADARGDFGDGIEGKLLPPASLCVLCVGKTRGAPIDANAVPREDFQNLKLGRQLFLSLKTILVRYDLAISMTTHRPISAPKADASRSGLMSNSLPIARPTRVTPYTWPESTLLCGRFSAVAAARTPAAEL